MKDKIIPCPMIIRSDKENVPDFLIPEGINEKTLRILGCDCGLGDSYGDVRVVHIGGRNKGKMKAMKEFIKLLRDDKRKDIVIVRYPDPLPELKGNRLPKLRLLPIELYDSEKQDKTSNP